MVDTLMSAVFDTLLVFAAVVGLILVLGALLLLFFDTESVKKRQLKRLGTRDYERARGTAHRLLLEKAAQNLKMQIDNYQRKNDTAKRAMSQHIKQRDAKLKQAVSRWLVENHLQEVPGISDRLKWEVVHTVFNRNLDDLKRSYVVMGIGEQKQQYINQWIDNYNAQIPHLMHGNFPGKLEIEEKYQPIIAAQAKLIAAGENAQLSPAARLVPIHRELSWLKKVNSGDFIQAYIEPGLAREDLDRYQIGVFAEWEPMPDWFQAEVANSAD